MTHARSPSRMGVRAVVARDETMDCPVCKVPMVVLEWDAVEVDFCTGCRGIWLDAGEIELLYGDAEACAAFLSAFNSIARPLGRTATS